MWTDNLRQYFARADVRERMMQSTWGGWLISAAESPPSEGYEPWLVDHGVGRAIAHMMASLIVRSGQRQAADSRRLSQVVQAIRFLAKPGRKGSAVSQKTKVLLAAWEETSVFDTIVEMSGFNGFEFIRALESAAKDDAAALLRVTAIFASVAPRLSVPRGRMACTRFRRHRVRCFDGTGGASWRGGSLRGSSSLRLCA
jgi:hypothetical protein